MWERVTWEDSPVGRVARTNSYTEIASGLNVLDEASGTYRPARSDFEITPEGYAVARQGQHRVIICPRLADSEGAIDLIGPDQRRMRSSILALNLYNRANGTSLVVAEVSPDAVGVQVAPNEILFTNAFGNEFSASVRYVYSLGDWRQEVLPLENLDAEVLAAAGFPVEDSVLEIWTAFFEAPEPKVEARVVRREANPVRRAQMAEPDIITEDLDFGVMKVPGGRIYLKGGEGQREHPARGGGHFQSLAAPRGEDVPGREHSAG